MLTMQPARLERDTLWSRYLNPMMLVAHTQLSRKSGRVIYRNPVRSISLGPMQVPSGKYVEQIP